MIPAASDPGLEAEAPPDLRYLEEVRYKTPLRRIGAFILDGILFWPVSWAMDALTPVAAVRPSVWALLIPLASSVLLYRILCHAWFGKTAGKWLLGVRVLDVSGRPLTLGQSALRELPLVFAGLVDLALRAAGYAPAGPAMPAEAIPGPVILGAAAIAAWILADTAAMVFHRRHRALHDLLGGTVAVVETRDRR